MAIYIMRDCTEVQREKLNPVALSSRTPLNHILELTDPLWELTFTLSTAQVVPRPPLLKNILKHFSTALLPIDTKSGSK